MSKDFEDLVYIFQNCDSFQEQIIAAPTDVINYLRNELGKHVNSAGFEEGVFSLSI